MIKKRIRKIEDLRFVISNILAEFIKVKKTDKNLIKFTDYIIDVVEVYIAGEENKMKENIIVQLRRLEKDQKNLGVELTIHTLIEILIQAFIKEETE